MREPYSFKLASGKSLELRYSFKAVRYFDKATGGNFFGDSAAGRIGASYLTAGIAAGLLWNKPDIKAEAIDALIEEHLDAGGSLPQLVEQLVEALQAGGVLQRSDTEAATRPTKTDPAPASE